MCNEVAPLANDNERIGEYNGYKWQDKKTSPLSNVLWLSNLLTLNKLMKKYKVYFTLS